MLAQSKKKFTADSVTPNYVRGEGIPNYVRGEGVPVNTYKHHEGYNHLAQNSSPK